jgi:glucosamine--fructose-6-phosphate aminotransferase (isomerizing)
MCGIIGYVGKRDSFQILIDGLRRLEYRGYDSAGIASCNGRGIEVYKTQGKINDLERIMSNYAQDCFIGIGHTRWATHGAPSSTNAHPHVSEGVAVVHNGIIENYKELKSFLQSKGQSFVSETDTEVIPQMIAWHLKEGVTVMEALRATISRLNGSYAIGVISEASPHVLYAVRKGSPLVVGVGEGENFISSDVPAILPYTKKVIYLEDGHICILDSNGLNLESVDPGTSIPVEDKIVGVDWTASMAEKNGYDHFMLKEIYDQPSSVRNTVNEWVEDPLRLIDGLGLTPMMIMGLRNIQIVACGTSYHAGLVGKYLIEGLVRIPVEADIASEYRYKNPIIEKDHTIFISITQSGETADTLAAQREAKERGARTITICNVVGSTAAREADSVIYTRAGPEIGVASTKSFTAQLAVLCLITIGLGIARRRLFSKEIDTLKSQLVKIPNIIEKTLANDSHVRTIAESLFNKNGYLYLGRGVNYPVALEGALKLKEISYVHAEGYPAGEMKHGPIALIEEDMPVVIMALRDHLYKKTVSSIEEAKARGAKIIVVTDECIDLEEKVDHLIKVPITHPVFSALVNVIPLQLLAYHIAVLKGCNVDQPRNLAKSVTVE